MKIVFVNRFFYPDISATSQLLSDLAFFLAERGHDVSIVTSRQLYQDPSSVLPSFERVRGVAVVRVATTRFGRARLMGRALDYLSFYVTAALALWRLLTPHMTVVAKTDPPLVSVVAALVCRMRRANLVNWVQDVFPEVAIASENRSIRAPLITMLKWFRNRSLIAAQRNVVLGDRMADHLMKSVAGSLSITVIANWTDGESVRPVPPDRNPLRLEWNLEGKFVVAYSGNMGRAHEFETIIAAAQSLRGHVDICFLFIGDGRWRGWLEGMKQRHGADNIAFQPYQPRERLTFSLGIGDVHLVSLLPAMEGLIVPSKFYGITAAGRPTVFIGDTDGEIPRILARYNIGLTVCNGDVDGLIEALLTLKGNTSARLSMGERARQVFEAHYNSRDALAKWENLLRGMPEAA